MAISEKLKEVKKTWRLIDDHFDDLFAACDTEEDRALLRDLHNSAHVAYLKAIADSMEANGPLVDKIQKDLKEANKEVKNRLSDLQEIKAVLDVAAEAVKLAASLATIGLG